MSSKAEIEAQIAALQARLRETIEYDRSFTPAELVRWDPSLVGTIFRIQHELDIPANPFQHTIFKDSEGKLFIWSRNAADKYTGGPVASPSRLGMCGILTSSGILLRNNPRYNSKPNGRSDVDKILGHVFGAIATMRVGALQVTSVIEKSYRPLDRFYLTDLSVTINYDMSHVCRSLGTDSIPGLSLPLANPEKCLLDQIFIVSYSRFPACESSAFIATDEVIIDKYPLSTLYQEWKRDKMAKRMHRRTPLDEAMTTIRALQEELRLAREARAAADTHSEKLRLALHASVGIKESENPV
jgi:hypothetical protein